MKNVDFIGFEDMDILVHIKDICKYIKKCISENGTKLKYDLVCHFKIQDEDEVILLELAYDDEVVARFHSNIYDDVGCLIPYVYLKNEDVYVTIISKVRHDWKEVIAEVTAEVTADIVTA